MHGKEQVVWLRPVDKLITMTILNDDQESPSLPHLKAWIGQDFW
jgi:hypothetical protein